MAEPERKLMTLDRAADRIGLSIHSVRRHVKEGRIKIVRVGKRLMVNTDEINRICNEGLPLDRPPGRPKKPKPRLVKN
jgi:excisionase family DNA binding protein